MKRLIILLLLSVFALLVGCTKGNNVASVEAITLNKATTNLEVGASETLMATVTPAHAYNRTVEWSSSNNDLAIVSAGGKVTAVAVGNVDIWATTVDGGFRATCNVVINPANIPVGGVLLDQVEMQLIQGANGQLKATVLPDNAFDKSIVWSTSNPTVATVSSAGEVSAVGVGTATITVTTIDGGHQAQCEVAVVAA